MFITSQKMSKKKYQIQEPTPKNSLDVKEHEAEIYAAYALYKTMSGSKEHKNWVLEYVKNNNKDASIYSKGKLKDYSPYGIWARMINRGITIPDKEKIELDSLLKRLEDKNRDYLESIQNAIVERNKKQDLQINDTLTNINVCIDNLLNHILSKKKNQFSIDGTFTRVDIPKNVYSIVIRNLSDKLNELYLARDKKDEQLVEGYSFLSKAQLKSYISTLEKAVEYYESKIQVNKSNRKPRKKKDKTADQIVRGVKYQEKDETGVIVSLLPLNVVGAKAICALNTKTKSLIVYSAKDGEVLSFKGTTLLNTSVSKCKKIRNYEKLVENKSFVFATYTHAEKFYNSLKTKESTSKTRLNSNTIILAIKK